MTRTWIVAPLMLLLAALSIDAQVPTPGQALQPPARRGRIFSPKDLGLLEPPDREAWQKPEQVMDALQIAEDSVVADLGAAGGWFTIRLARRVGSHGLVYAEDVQRLMIEAIERRVQREGLTNVKTILGEYDDPFPGLPANTLDAVLIVDAFHEIEQPVVLLRNVGRTLKPSGLIGIIEYRPGDGGPGPDPEDRVAPSAIIDTATAAGLKLVGQDNFLRYQYFLRFGK
jgi:predicted methyltransferase